MILQLEQIALNYSRTLEGQKAEEMLKYLKSDLKIENTDDSGNKINEAPPKKHEIPMDLDVPPTPRKIADPVPRRPQSIKEEAPQQIASPNQIN